MTGLVRRTLLFLLGVFFVAFGIALSVRADLGTAPIASFPTVLSFATPISVGTYIMILNLIFVGLQIAVLRRKFRPLQFIQIPLSIAFGLFVDLSMYLTRWVNPTHYVEQWAWIIASVLLLAFGVYVEMQARLTYLPANGIVFALYTVLQNIPYGTIKIIFDTVLVALSVISSLMLLGGLYGVREGTVFAALTVGLVLRGISAIHNRLSPGATD